MTKDPSKDDFLLIVEMGLINRFGGQTGKICKGLADGSITIMFDSYVCRLPSFPDVKTTMVTDSKTYYVMTPGGTTRLLSMQSANW